MANGSRTSARRTHRRALKVESLEERRLLASAWQNPMVPADVNDDSVVSPVDLLIVINELKRNGTRELGTRTIDTSIGFVDISGDGILSPLDVLQGINALSSRSSAPSANFLNLKSFGAKGDGVTDDLAAINRALSAARTQNKKLYVPAGTYLHSAPFSIESQEVFGVGDRSTFLAGDALNSVIYLRGTNPVLRSVSHVIQSGSLPRQSTGQQASVAAWECDGFLIDNVTIIGGTSIGILSYGSKGTSSAPARITNCRVSDTLADTIHLTYGSEWIVVENCICRNGGDDGIAVVSYIRDEHISNNIVIRNNDVGYNTWGRGIAVVGATDVLIENNTVARTDSAGILVYSEESWQTKGVQRVVVRNNRLTEVGYHIEKQHPAILIGGRRDYLVEDITVVENTITRPNFDGVRVDGFVTTIALAANTFTDLTEGRRALNISDEAQPHVTLS
jgi:hypothetical protein